jgi:hypothetical protein
MEEDEGARLLVASVQEPQKAAGTKPPWFWTTTLVFGLSDVISGALSLSPHVLSHTQHSIPLLLVEERETIV